MMRGMEGGRLSLPGKESWRGTRWDRLLGKAIATAVCVKLAPNKVTHAHHYDRLKLCRIVATAVRDGVLVCIVKT